MIQTYKDDRGFLDVIQSKKYDQVFVSSNDCIFTFRGMHYQTEPYSQSKTLRVIQGEIIDFLYNLNTGEVEQYKLDKDSPPLYIGKEYAHGFLTTRLNTILLYCIEGEYNEDSYKSIPYNTIPKIKDIVNEHAAWATIKISDKDKNGK